jgi:hypothetical protein
MYVLLLLFIAGCVVEFIALLVHEEPEEYELIEYE